MGKSLPDLSLNVATGPGQFLRTLVNSKLSEKVQSLRMLHTAWGIAVCDEISTIMNITKAEPGLIACIESLPLISNKRDVWIGNVKACTLLPCVSVSFLLMPNIQVLDIGSPDWSGYALTEVLDMLHKVRNLDLLSKMHTLILRSPKNYRWGCLADELTFPNCKDLLDFPALKNLELVSEPHTNGCEHLSAFPGGEALGDQPTWHSNIDSLVLCGWFGGSMNHLLPAFHKLKSLTYILTVPCEVFNHRGYMPDAQFVFLDVLPYVSRTLETLVIHGKPSPCQAHAYGESYMIAPYKLNFPNLKVFDLDGAGSEGVLASAQYRKWSARLIRTERRA